MAQKHIFSEFVGFEIISRRERRDLQLGVGGGPVLDRQIHRYWEKVDSGFGKNGQ